MLPHEGHSLLAPGYGLTFNHSADCFLHVWAEQPDIVCWFENPAPGLQSSLAPVRQRASQHMFDSDQIFEVCVDPPTRGSEGQLHQINVYQVLR